MDETTFRILDTLSRSLGENLSINQLTEKISTIHPTAYYKNIYDKIQELKDSKIIFLEDAGKSKIARLNFENENITSLMIEIELKKMQQFMEKRIEFKRLADELADMNQIGFIHIKSLAIIQPEKNARLNKIDLIILMQKPMPFQMRNEQNGKTSTEEFKGKQLEEMLQEEIRSIYSHLQSLSKIHHIAINALILTKEEFKELMQTREENPIHSIFIDEISIYGANELWGFIRKLETSGTQIQTMELKNSAAISKKELSFNAYRFGYTEFGEKMEETRKIGIESTICALLIQGSARQIEAIPAIIGLNLNQKNGRKINLRLLTYLCQQSKQLEMFYGLLEELYKEFKDWEIENEIQLLEAMKVTPKKTDSKAIKEKMRLYNAI